MSGVLHPVGPEPVPTYWARRLVVLVVLAVVGLVVALVVSGAGSRSAVSAVPAPPPGGAPPVTSPTPTSTAQAEPSPSPSSGGAASPTPTGSAASTASTTASPATTVSPGTTPSASAGPSGPAACRPDQLRATLTGRPTLRPEQDHTFGLSLLNGSDASCAVSVLPDTFELTISFGSDQIWSSDDCSSAVQRLTRTVGAGDAVEWTMTWDGMRSRDACKTRPESLRPGIYYATAQLDGAKPVRLRMILRG